MVIVRQVILVSRNMGDFYMCHREAINTVKITLTSRYVLNMVSIMYLWIYIHIILNLDEH